MNLALNLLIGLAPIVLICLFVYLRDSARPEKPLHLLVTFLLGAAFAYPAWLIESQIDNLGYQNSVEFLPYTLYMFVGVALVEEGMKYLPVLLYPFRRSFFDEPLDGIVYCVYAAMGFATVETVIFAGLLDWEGMLAKATLAVPAHAAFAMLAGYFLGRARRQTGRGARNRYVLLGLLWSVVAHGLYDWFVFNPFADWLTLLAIAVLVVSWGVAMRLTAKHAQGPEPTPLASGRA